MYECFENVEAVWLSPTQDNSVEFLTVHHKKSLSVIDANNTINSFANMLHTYTL